MSFLSAAWGARLSSWSGAHVYAMKTRDGRGGRQCRKDLLQELRANDAVASGRTVMPVKIGVISDTHGLLRPEAEQRLAGVAQIIHAGDIGRPDVIAGLNRIAPVIAIRGNVDTGAWAEVYPHTAMARLGGRSLYILHDVHELDLDPVAGGVDVVISGHSHQPRSETVHGVLYLNPGSAGPRRFNLPITLAILELDNSGMRPVIHDLVPRTTVSSRSGKRGGE
jgi:putative phosphoesterase